MSKLNRDTLFLLFEELQDDSESLFSCLMVNRLWCETVIPILWKNPWKYDNINYHNSSLYYIITSYLPDDTKELLTGLGIQFPSISHQSLLFDYLSLCRSMNMNVINNIISVGSSSPYNQFLLQQEIYSLFIKKCPEFKYLDMRSIKHQIFNFPEAKIPLNSICELTCNLSTDSSYFYGIAYLCQNIQRLIIINTDGKDNHGIVKLIEAQNNLEYFEWKDDDLVDYDDLIGYPYKEVFMALAKKADTLRHFIVIFFQEIYEYYFNFSFLQDVLPKFYKLRTLKFSPIYLDGYDFEEALELSIYHDLDDFKIDDIGFKSVTCMIENTGGHLRKLSIDHGEYAPIGDYNEESLILISTIYKKCPLIEYLSLEFPITKDHFIEFERLLKNCQKLKVLLLFVLDVDDDKMDVNELLRILIRSAPMNLREIRLVNINEFSLESLKEFLEKWRGRCALSIITCHEKENYVKLFNKYKNDGVIKDFRCVNRSNLFF